MSYMVFIGTLFFEVLYLKRNEKSVGVESSFHSENVAISIKLTVIKSRKANQFSFFLYICSATIENGTLISHDLHNALAVIKSDQTIPQQQTPAIAATAATTTAITNTNTASHSGSSGRSTPNNTDSAPGKLFVGGLSWQTSADKLKEYFGMFGNVTDVLIMKDPVTQVGIFFPKKRKRLIINALVFLFPKTEEPWIRFYHILRAY